MKQKQSSFEFEDTTERWQRLAGFFELHPKFGLGLVFAYIIIGYFSGLAFVLLVLVAAIFVWRYLRMSRLVAAGWRVFANAK